MLRYGLWGEAAGAADPSVLYLHPAGKQSLGPYVVPKP